MPSRTILNKYGLFVSEVRKVAKKKEFCNGDHRTKQRAALIASLSSRHSWQTYRYLRDGGNFDRAIVSQEVAAAFGEGWRNISEADVEEVVNSPVSENVLYMWLFCAFGKSNRGEYRDLLLRLKTEFVDGLEPIERIRE